MLGADCGDEVTGDDRFDVHGPQPSDGVGGVSDEQRVEVPGPAPDAAQSVGLGVDHAGEREPLLHDGGDAGEAGLIIDGVSGGRQPRSPRAGDCVEPTEQHLHQQSIGGAGERAARWSHERIGEQPIERTLPMDRDAEEAGDTIDERGRQIRRDLAHQGLHERCAGERLRDQSPHGASGLRRGRGDRGSQCVDVRGGEISSGEALDHQVQAFIGRRRGDRLGVRPDHPQCHRGETRIGPREQFELLRAGADCEIEDDTGAGTGPGTGIGLGTAAGPGERSAHGVSRPHRPRAPRAPRDR